MKTTAASWSNIRITRPAPGEPLLQLPYAESGLRLARHASLAPDLDSARSRQHRHRQAARLQPVPSGQVARLDSGATGQMVRNQTRTALGGRAQVRLQPAEPGTAAMPGRGPCSPGPSAGRRHRRPAAAIGPRLLLTRIPGARTLSGGPLCAHKALRTLHGPAAEGYDYQAPSAPRAAQLRELRSRLESWPGLTRPVSVPPADRGGDFCGRGLRSLAENSDRSGHHHQ